MTTKPEGPPFDGKPCPACPLEVRNLHACVHNMLVAYDTQQQYPCPDFAVRLHRKIEELRSASAKMKALADAHFADPSHSHGIENPKV